MKPLNRYFYRLYKFGRIFLLPFVPIYLLLFYILKLTTRQKKYPFPIICIGNLTTGGSGKTPAVIYLASMLSEEGFSPGIVSRGYKGTKSKDGALVSDGRNLLLTPEQAGDEPCLMAMSLKNVPIAIGSSRKHAIDILMKRFDVNIIIMDDGFQNNSINKDISILTIDATNPFGNGLILPAGDLREPTISMKRSDIVIINRFNLTPQKKLQLLKNKILKRSPNHKIFQSKYTPDILYKIHNSKNSLPLSNLKGKRILLITAIGNPNSFMEIVKTQNPKNVKLISYPDHHMWSLSDCKKIIKKSHNYDYVIVTEKDYVKLRKFNLTDKFYTLRIHLDIEENNFFKQSVISLINKIISHDDVLTAEE